MSHEDCLFLCPFCKISVVDYPLGYDELAMGFWPNNGARYGANLTKEALNSVIK